LIEQLVNYYHFTFGNLTFTERMQGWLATFALSLSIQNTTLLAW